MHIQHTLPHRHMCAHVYNIQKRNKNMEGKGDFKRDGSGDTWLYASHRYLDFGLSMIVGIVIGCPQVLAVFIDATLAYGG